jgi:hypothetical protein
MLSSPASLTSICLKDIAEKLPSDLNEDIIKSLSPDALQRLKDLFVFRVWAVYKITAHEKGFGEPRFYSYQFLGVFSDVDKARERTFRYEKTVPKTKTGPRTTVIEYTLDAMKGRRLFRLDIPHSSVDEGLFPVTNDQSAAHSPLNWMYGGATRFQKSDEVFINTDY